MSEAGLDADAGLNPVAAAGCFEFRGVGHCYGARHILDEVSFHIAPGEVLSLLGPSGCGKTTCLRLAAGLEDLQHGEILMDNEVIARPGKEIPAEKRRFGYVFQDFALFPHLSAADNVGFGLKGQGKAETARIVAELLTTVGLADRGDAWPHQLSGGEQQRVALARALAPAPRLMLLDEPFSSLDVLTRRQLRAETREIIKARGVPSLLVTHDPDEAAQVGDRIAVMQDGRIVQCGTAQDLKSAPANDFVRELFAGTA